MESIPAIFESGVFRPLVPLQLDDGARVQLSVEATAPPVAHDATLERQGKWIASMIEEAQSLPLESKGEAFSGSDHDAALYDRP